MDLRWKRLLTIFLVLALGTVALAACGADDEGDETLATEEPLIDEGLGEDEGIVDDEELLDETPVVEEPLVEETDEVEVTPAVEEPPLGDAAAAGETIDYLDRDEELLDDGQVMAGTYVTSDTYIGMELVSPTDVLLGEVVDAFFDMSGDIQYVVVDLEEEADVEIETIFGTELLNENVDTVMISDDLLRVTAQTTDEMAQAAIESPARLILLEDFGQGIPFIAQDIDAAALESEQVFIDPSRFNLDDQDVGANELLQMSHYEFFDAADHEILTAEGEDLGEIDELVVDLVNGTVAYAIVETGGFLGIGENSTAIPWDQFSYETTDQDFVVNVDAAALESAPTITDEDFDNGLFDTDLAAETETFFEEQPAREEPPLGDASAAGESIDYLDRDEELLDNGQVMTGTYVTSDAYIGMELVSATDVLLGEVVDAFFDMSGDIQYVVIDLEEEADVEIENTFGTDLFNENVDTVMISDDLLRVTAQTTDEMAQATMETPARLLLLQDFGQDIPFIAQDIDAAALESEQVFLDPSRFNLDDQDVGANELLQMTHYEFFDLADHEILTPDGEDLGDLDELVVDLVNGTVAYAIVDTGGFLGIGDNLTAIPWDRFSYETTDQDFVVDTDAATLESAPAVTDADFDNGLFDTGLAGDVDDFWTE